MEQWIFLLVLASIAAFVVYLLRQASKREAVPSQPDSACKPVETAAPKEIALAPLPQPQPLAPAATSDPSVKLVVTPLTILPTPSVVQALDNSVTRRSQRKLGKKAVPNRDSLGPAPNPVDSVLGMLKQRDMLATAWLLGEIFGPPRSRRRL